MSKLILRQSMQSQADLELAVLVGSRANGSEGLESDWDIAIRWKKKKGTSDMDNLANTETLRRKLAAALIIMEDKIDLIDLTKAGLAMRAQVAEEGIVLKGEGTLSWNHFLARVWRDLEDFQWERQHEA